MDFLLPCSLPSSVPDPDGNVVMIESSLRNCSISGTAITDLRQPVMEVGPRRDAIPVELNSQVPLPRQWEQFLDIQTGEIYYINWADGTKTSRDPRWLASSSDEEEPSSAVEDDGEKESSDESYGDISSNSDDGYLSSSSDISTVTSSDIISSSKSPDGQGNANRHNRRRSRSTGPILVLIGCKACLAYFMVEKPATECPNCRGGDAVLVHFGS